MIKFSLQHLLLGAFLSTLCSTHLSPAQASHKLPFDRTTAYAKLSLAENRLKTLDILLDELIKKVKDGDGSAAEGIQKTAADIKNTKKELADLNQYISSYPNEMDERVD